MNAPGEKLKRKRGPRMTFGELVQKFWQLELEALEPKAAQKKQRKPAGK
jgi:hypothetical protein